MALVFGSFSTKSGVIRVSLNHVNMRRPIARKHGLNTSNSDTFVSIRIVHSADRYTAGYSTKGISEKNARAHKKC